MISTKRLPVFLLAFLPIAALADETKWQYAGESQGISFQLQIRNECKDNAKVTVKMKSQFDRPVTVSFRLNDSDWRKTFNYKIKANAKDATVHYAPDEGSVCHPFIDQIYVESEESMVTQSESEPSAGE